MAALVIGFSDNEYHSIEAIFKTISCNIRRIKVEKFLDRKKTKGFTFKPDEIDVFLIDDKILPPDPAEACARIKEIKKAITIHGILVIAQPLGVEAKRIIESGLMEFVRRPLDPLDIVTRIRTCKQLQEAKTKQAIAEQWFYQVVESMPVIFAEYEDGITVKYGNRLGADIWGIPHEEILNPPDRWIRYIHPEDKDRVIQAIKALDQKSLYIQYRIIRPDGQLRWIEDSFIPIRDENGLTQKVFGFGKDITKRKLAEFSLQKSEEHLRFLMETVTNFAIYRLSFEEGDFFRSNVIFVSPSIVDILGVTEPSFEAWLASFHPEDAKTLEKDLMTRPVPKKYENVVRVFHPIHQEWRWIQFIANRTLDEKDHLKYSSGIMFDVTERIKTSMALKEKEKELSNQTNKLEKLNDALSVLLEYREKEVENVKKNTLGTLKKLVTPYIQDIYLTNINRDQQTLLDIVSSHLENVTSSFARALSTWKGKLSPTEIKVADLVRSGKTTKEISELLKVSSNAVSFHRSNIRSKLGIVNKKMNLTSYLLTLELDS